jgi:hypothetical protein
MHNSGKLRRMLLHTIQICLINHYPRDYLAHGQCEYPDQPVPGTVAKSAGWNVPSAFAGRKRLRHCAAWTVHLHKSVEIV